MYGRDRNGPNPPRSSTEPPWATDYRTSRGSYTTSNRATYNNYPARNNRTTESNNRTRPGGYNTAAGSNNAAVGSHGNTAAVASASRSNNRDWNEITSNDSNRDRYNRWPYRLFRYGGRLAPRAHERDLDFATNFRPYAAPSGTNSHRERERVRRDDRERDNNRIRNEGEERSLVPEEKPLAKNVLTIKHVNLHHAQNAREHHTSEYDCVERPNNPQLVVRRGQAFYITFTFQRPFSPKEDDLFLEFSVGKTPNEVSGTLEKFQLSETDSTRYKKTGNWGARIAKQDGHELTVFIYIAPDAIIGEWECHVTTSLTNQEAGNELFQYTGVPDIFVLFNPWCQEDQVYYSENPSDLNEYILNEYGCVFSGTSDYIGRKAWYYGQFQDSILDTCMVILRLAFDSEINQEMGDAVTVARKLSRVINNSAKDPGVLTGNWSGNYAGGTSPSNWRGSVQILKEYARTKKAVKYGQCWVFSALLTTVCRALGIPCRSLTNYESAHDTDRTCTIDSYKDHNGEDLAEYKTDSVWNYHCWNDVWINRPDLDMTSSARGRHSGWHAVDATPQERSEGRYQCGPTPHRAIKHGEISVGHDTGFIFAEVNGEVCTWMVPPNMNSKRDLKLVSRDTSSIGKSISTKIPDGKPAHGTFNPGAREVHEKRMDITHLYKFREGSEEERSAMKLAVGRDMGTKLFETPGGISVEIIKPTEILAGKDFTFSAVFSNSSRDSRSLKLVTMGVFPIDYRGERLGWDKIAYKKAQHLQLRPGERQRVDVLVTEGMYMKLCDKSLSMMLRASASIEGEEKPVTKMQKIALSVPTLGLQVPTGSGKLRRGLAFPITLMITNPLKKPLTGCSLQMTGPAYPVDSQGFSSGDGSFHKRLKDIFPHQTSTLTFDIVAQERPLHNHVREVNFVLTSDQLADMEGSVLITLQS